MTQLDETAKPARIRLSSNFDRLRFIYYLTAIQIQNEIKNYTLGFLWWFLDPLVNTVIFYVLTTAILHVRNDDVALHLLTGLLAFRFLQAAITGGSGSLRPAFRLSDRLYVPKYVFVVSDVLAEAFKFLIGIAVVVVLLFFLGRGKFEPLHLMLATVVAFLFALACASVVSVIISLISDFQIAIQYAFRLLFFISGTFFSLEQVPEQWHTLFLLNPFALLIQEYRVALLIPGEPNYGLLALLTVASLVLLAFGRWVLVRLDRVLPKYVI